MIFYLSRKPRGTFLRFTHFTTLVILCLTILSFPSSIFVKADEDPQPCTVTNETTNKYYDLSSLTKTEGGDWIVYGYGTGWTFYMNVCHGVLYRDKNDDVSEFQDIGVYGVNPEYYKFEKDHNIGQISNEPLIRGDKLIMEFSNGKKCGTTNYRSTSVVSFICDKTVEGQGQPIFISSFEDCAFLFEWRTPAACPTDKIDASKGGWGVFFTIFIIALIVYFVGGIIYNRMVHNAIGMHQIPNWEFWSNACDFLKDMIVIIFAQCPVFNKPRRHGGRNYRNLPRDEENILIEEEFEEH